MTDAKTGIDRIPWYTAPALLLGVPAVIAILAMISPTTFYDNFVWKYYWGPIVADAAGGTLYHNGVAASGGYNIVNTLSWAVLMGVCLLGLTQMLNGLKQKMNNTFILGATGWVVAGSIWHVMQDAKLFEQPLEYFFITPPIYLLFAAGGIFSLLLGHDLKKTYAAKGLPGVFAGVWLAMSAIILVYTGLWASNWDQIVHFVNPFWLVITGMVTMFLIMRRMQRVGLVPEEMVLMLSIWPILMSLLYVMEFNSGAFGKNPGNPIPWILIVTPLGSAAIAGVVYAVARNMNVRESTGLVTAEEEAMEATEDDSEADATAEPMPSKRVLLKRAFTSPINLVLVASQLVDGIGTAIGLDVAHYSEKHVLSALVIDNFRSLAENIGWAHGAEYGAFYSFIPVKFLVSMLVIYAIDVSSYEDSQKNPVMIGFVKFAIIMVGIGPGVRNITRIALGV
ncbi:MAG: DUF63 family protein [Thermoplasmatota archaeon]